MREIRVFLVVLLITAVHISLNLGSYCGCITLRPCYQNMLDVLLGADEVSCIENAAIGTATLTVFLKALQQFCGEIVTITPHDHTTYEGRVLYQILLTKDNGEKEPSKPTILLDAGQQAGTQSVGFALYIIEQLVACLEYNDFLERVKWVILPSANPDGQEYARMIIEPTWSKNRNQVEGQYARGVDISRNFQESWGVCPAVTNENLPEYAGPSAQSETETVFISNVLAHFQSSLRAYVSIRRDGHAILYPYASVNSTDEKVDKARKLAGDIAAKVNQRAATVQWFNNNSIFNMNGKPYCGHSVDLVSRHLGLPYAFEMRVFPESDNYLISKFQPLPQGYETNLRNAYFSGIRELYNFVVNEDKENAV